MRSNIPPIFLCLLLTVNIASSLFYLLDVHRINGYNYLQIPNAYAYTIDNPSLTSSQTFNENNGQGSPPDGGPGSTPDCDQADPTCQSSELPCDPIASTGNCLGTMSPGDGRPGVGPTPPPGCGEPNCAGAAGGPPVPTVPGDTISPIGDQNNGISGGQTILTTAFQTHILPTQVEGGLPRENICDDGLDNNHNGLVDSDDSSCHATVESFGSDILDKRSLNVSYAGDLSHNGITDASVISISGGSRHDIRTMSSFHYGYSPVKVTVEKGSTVTWTNQDPDGPHGINIIDKTSGKIIFSYPIIRSGASTFYYFGEVGQFAYSDPMYPSMSGEITVVR